MGCTRYLTSAISRCKIARDAGYAVSNYGRQGVVVDNISMGPLVLRVNRHGKGLCVLLTRAVTRGLPWRHRDAVAARLVGEKLVLERIPVESMARIRTGEPQTHEASLLGKDHGNIIA